jgi:hypothetical protein
MAIPKANSASTIIGLWKPSCHISYTFPLANQALDHAYNQTSIYSLYQQFQTYESTKIRLEQNSIISMSGY